MVAQNKFETMSARETWHDSTFAKELVRAESLGEATDIVVNELLSRSKADVAAVIYGRKDFGRIIPSFGSIAYNEVEQTPENKSSDRRTRKSDYLSPQTVHACQAEAEFMESKYHGKEVTMGAKNTCPRFQENVGSHCFRQTVKFITFKSIPLDYSANCVLELIQFSTDSRAAPNMDNAQLLKQIDSVALPVLELKFRSQRYDCSERRKHRILESLCSVSYHSPGEDSLGPMVDCIQTVLVAQRVHLYKLRNESATEVTLVDLITEDCYPTTKWNLAGYVALQGNSLNLEASSSEWQRFEADQSGVRTALIIPITDPSGEVVGVIKAVNRLEAFQWGLKTTDYSNEITVPDTSAAWPFSSEDERMLSSLCPYIANVFENMANLREARTQSLISECILDVLRTDSSAEDIEDIFETISHSASKITASQEVCLFLVGHSSRKLYPTVVREDKIHLFDESHARHAAESGQTIYDQSKSILPQLAVLYILYLHELCTGILHDQQGYYKYLSIPIRLRSSSRPIAVLQIVDRNPDWVLSCRNRQALEAFCFEAGMALRNLSVDLTFASLFEQGKSPRRPGIQETLNYQDDARGKERTFSLLQQFADSEITKKLQKRFISTYTLLGDESSEHSPELQQTPGHVASGPKPVTFLDEVLVANEKLHENDPLFSWEFNCLHIQPFELKPTIGKLITFWKVGEHFSVPHEKLTSFVTTVESSYRDNPFHNFYHAVDTMHCTFMMVTTTGASNCLTLLDILSVLVAALCHDIDHPGHSQNLEIARESELALRYNDTAVLESYHAHKTFQLLKSDDMNIFCNLTQDQYKYCRKSILKCILGTDMSKHFLLLENLMNRVGRAKNKDISMGSSEHDKSFGRLSSASASSSTGMLFDRHDDGDRLELLEMIVHTADLSGQASPYEEAKQWGDKVISEFKDERLQHEKEGFSPPAFMDGIDSRYDELMLQSSFIKNIVQPLWEWMHEALGSLDEPVEYLQRNREKYEKEAASIETG